MPEEPTQRRTTGCVRTPPHLTELHHRASLWYAEQSMIEAAIHHALTAGDSERAATLVEQHAMPLLQSEEVSVVRTW